MEKQLLKVSGKALNDFISKYEFIDNNDIIIDDLLEEIEKLERVVTETNDFEIEESSYAAFAEEIPDTGKLVNMVMGRIDNAIKNNGTKKGILTGFEEFDRRIGGFAKGELILVGARPGMGKTGLLLSIAKNVATNQSLPVCIFNSEKSATELTIRLIGIFSEVSSFRLERGNLDINQINNIKSSSSSLAKLPIYIDDTACLKIAELEDRCRYMVYERKVAMIIIDDIDEIEIGNFHLNKDKKADILSFRLKQLAKELKVPILVSIQIKRTCESRSGTKLPHLSDLPGVNITRHIADKIILLYRPEYYGLESDENNKPTKGLAELFLACNRNGWLSSTTIYFNDVCGYFGNLPNPELSNINVPKV